MRGGDSNGFTLIELLVVVAIIGLLASIILVSLTTARAKGRDARRLADLKEMANAMELASAGTKPITLTGCTTAGSLASACATASTGLNLSSYADPSGVATACASKTGTVNCNYTMEIANGTTQNFEICVYLETQSGPLTTVGGMVSVSQTGNIIAGCP
ncbi:MAG TPA: prepilin-type N-terminal cleavage/methylation domain-containing protein [Candidatus Paceibacterota bacterium]|nr:prepilin-type N-terminal cleavage/methylation domain-containing protein [Candidatus Paceibacterota bacterium]